jgi:valyl-tRNA synthetase
MALVFSAAPGNDPIFDEQKVKGMKHFANKLWNIARYILANTESSVIPDSTKGDPESNTWIPNQVLDDSKLTDADKDILKKLDTLTAEVSKYIEDFQLHIAAQGLYQFVWYEFADVYIEASKSQLEDEKLKENTQKILLHTLIMIIKLLHPFIPFITEEIWSMMQKAGLLTEKNLLLISPWPKQS